MSSIRGLVVEQMMTLGDEDGIDTAKRKQRSMQDKLWLLCVRLLSSMAVKG